MWKRYISYLGVSVGDTGFTQRNLILPARGACQDISETCRKGSASLTYAQDVMCYSLWSSQWVFTRGSGWHRISHRGGGGYLVGSSYHRCSVKSGSKHLRKSRQQVLAWHNHHLRAARTHWSELQDSQRAGHTVSANTFLCVFRVCWLSVNSRECAKKICKWEESRRREKKKQRELWNTDSQFDGFVPHDDVAWESEGLHVDNVDVSPFCADVKPFALEGQVAVCDSARREIRIHQSPAFHYLMTQSHQKSHPCP